MSAVPIYSPDKNAFLSFYPASEGWRLYASCGDDCVVTKETTISSYVDSEIFHISFDTYEDFLLELYKIDQLF